MLPPKIPAIWTKQSSQGRVLAARGPYSWFPAQSSLWSDLGSPTLQMCQCHPAIVHKHVSTWAHPCPCEQRWVLNSVPITSYSATAWGKREGSQPGLCLPLASPTLGVAKSEPMLSHEAALKKPPLLSRLQLPCLSKEHIRWESSNSCYWLPLAVHSILLIWSQQWSHTPKGSPEQVWLELSQKQIMRQNWNACSWLERWS